jgi:iron complex outermembrane receptor protein
MRLRVLAMWAAFMPGVGPVLSQEAAPPATQPGQPRPTTERQEVVVVTPCRGCLTTVINSPAAVSVISSEAIASASDRSFGELLRTVPGVNAVRTSTREYNVTSRQSTSTLSNSQLVLVDGRSIYLDFIGTILWDMIPIDPADIEQIEVVRGPASAVWGANAFTGVVNVITRSPLASEGSSIQLNLSQFGRDAGSSVGKGPGMAYGGTTTISRALSERFAYRVSGGYSVSEPLARPAGILPLVPHPLEPGTLVGGGELPADDESEAGDFRNRGTTQPRMDLRFDHVVGPGRLTYSGGVAGTDGIVHSGIGPFNLERGSYLGYARVSYARGTFRTSAFVNLFGSRAPNLLLVGPDDERLRLRAQTGTYDVDVSHSRLIGSRHILTYGGNARRDTFNVTLAPNAKDRTEIGAYVQDEIYIDRVGDGSEFRFALGTRVDRFGNISSPVLSPRLSATWKPAPNQSLRFSINRAFRSPSVINNYLDAVVLRPIDLKALLPGLSGEYAAAVEEDFKLQQRVLGNRSLRQESLTSYELGYTAAFRGRTVLGINVYVNDTDDNINFARLADRFDPYTASDPPPGWPLPPSFLSDLATRGVFLGRTANQFMNLGPIRHKGVELFVEHRFSDVLTGFLNHSWQPEPRVLPATVPFPRIEITLPPRNRVNAGVHWTGQRFVGSFSMNHAERAFWVDVLPHDFDGYSPAYTTFNASFGAQWAGGKVVTTLRATNLLNAEVVHHDFGDILKRTLTAEVRFRF